MARRLARRLVTCRRAASRRAASRRVPSRRVPSRRVAAPPPGRRRAVGRRVALVVGLLIGAQLPPAGGFPGEGPRGGLLDLPLPIGSAPAAAQQDELARVKVAFPGAPGDRIVDLIREAGEEGLPTGLLVRKALEGAHKSAPPERVLETVADYAEELREARAAVGREVGDEALKEAADALRRGVPAASIRSLARMARDDLDILFVVMFDLMDDGVPPRPAEALVEDALRHGVDGDRMLSIPATVRQLIRGGLEPGEAADSVRRQIGGGTAWLPASGRRGGLVGRWLKEPPGRGGVPGRPFGSDWP